MNRSRIRATIAVGATAAAVSLPAAATPAFASSEGVTITYSCTEPPYPAGEADFTVFVKAPKKVFEGRTIKLKAAIESVDPTKVDVPAGGVVGTLAIGVGGPVTTSVTATGLTNEDAVPIGEQVLQDGGTASLTASAPGVYTFTPGEIVITTWMDTTLDCLPESEAVVATTTVLPH
ncbi:hypothetical protein OK074_1547 [Actinobacteria bacterium OK074]|nr:hypothetical protein OK074_1547 [Actinobacteria bacterium OK074]